MFIIKDQNVEQVKRLAGGYVGCLFLPTAAAVLIKEVQRGVGREAAQGSAVQYIGLKCITVHHCKCRWMV